jgi:hypothetical protein
MFFNPRRRLRILVQGQMLDSLLLIPTTGILKYICQRLFYHAYWHTEPLDSTLPFSFTYDTPLDLFQRIDTAPKMSN